jgi:hypothetical protein
LQNDNITEVKNLERQLMKRIAAFAFKPKGRTAVRRSLILLALGFSPDALLCGMSRPVKSEKEITLFPAVIMSPPISILRLRRKRLMLSLPVNYVR